MTGLISVQQIEPVFEQARAMLEERVPDIAPHVIITRLRRDAEEKKLVVQLRVTDIAKTTFEVPRDMLLGLKADPAICEIIADACNRLISFARTAPAAEELRKLLEKADAQVKRFGDSW